METLEATTRTPNKSWVLGRGSKTITLNGFIPLQKKDEEGNLLGTKYLNKALISEVDVGESSDTIMLSMNNGVKYFVDKTGVNIVVTDNVPSGGGDSGGSGDDPSPEPSGIARRLKLTDQNVPQNEYELMVANGRLKIEPSED